jgi:murein DD-endopeptidase MepM/ murein hydrolase activator NlpD
VDLRATRGQPVLAAGPGRVTYAGLLAGRGVVVVVHGGLRSTYEPVAATVRVGDVVAAGARLGHLTAGGHCAPGCLHWGLLRGDVYLDPVQVVRRGPSRLLPVPPDALSALLPPGGRGAGPGARPSSSAAPLPVQPATQPGLDLRAAQLPWGGAALVALLAGLLLLRPARAGAPPPRPAAPPVERPGAAGEALVDLATERSRRRVG